MLEIVVVKMFSDYIENGPQLLGNPKNKIQAHFRFKNTNVTLANTLRRAILTLTPNVAFRTEPFEKSDIVIRTNTTPLVNEIIAHRIGMIPIKADPLTFDPEHYEFILDKENTSKEIMNISASDFVIRKKNPDNLLEAPVEVPTTDFFPPDPITGDTVLITRLRPQWNPTAPNERIQLTAKAAISNGHENIRWSPVSQCSYEYTRDTDEAHIEEVFKNWLSNNKKIQDTSSVGDERIAELRREFNTMEIQRCFLKDEKGEPFDFTFHVESVGIQTIQTIVRAGLAACEALVTKYQDLDAVLPETVKVQIGDARFQSIDIIFQHESHTFGNLVETYLVKELIEAKTDIPITFAAYKVPHPLRPEMFVRIGIDKEITDINAQKSIARKAIASVCRKLKGDFRALSSAWDAIFVADAV